MERGEVGGGEGKGWKNRVGLICCEGVVLFRLIERAFFLKEKKN